MYICVCMYLCVCVLHIMYVWIHVCMCVYCMFVCVCVSICMYIYFVCMYVLYICICVCMCVSMCIYYILCMYVCMYVCKVYACLCVCFYVSMYVCMYLCIYIYICICVFWLCFCILSLYTAQSQIAHPSHSGAAVTWTLRNATITTALYTASRVRSVCLQAHRQWDGSGAYLRKSHLEYFREASKMFEPLQTSQQNSISGFSERRSFVVVVGICESGECIDTEKTRTFAVSLFRFISFIRPF